MKNQPQVCANHSTAFCTICWPKTGVAPAPDTTLTVQPEPELADNFPQVDVAKIERNVSIILGKINVELEARNLAAIKIVETWRHFPVASGDSVERARAGIKECTAHVTAADKIRLELTSPFRTIVEIINKSFKRFVTDEVETEKGSLNKQVVSWRQKEQDRILAENKKRAAEELALRKKQIEDAVKAAPPAAEEPPPERIAIVEREPDLEVKGQTDHWKFEIMDPQKLAREWLMPDEARIGKAVRAGNGQVDIAGIRTFNEPSTR